MTRRRVFVLNVVSWSGIWRKNCFLEGSSVLTCIVNEATPCFERMFAEYAQVASMRVFHCLQRHLVIQSNVRLINLDSFNQFIDICNLRQTCSLTDFIINCQRNADPILIRGLSPAVNPVCIKNTSLSLHRRSASSAVYP